MGPISKKHLPALDGLRGVAILLVLCCHLAENCWAFKYPWRILPIIGGGGWVGVDLFFVLSGFLITGILWDDRGSRRYFKNFYIRRTLRLAPLYYTTLLVIFCILPALLPYIRVNNPMVVGASDEIANIKNTAAFWPWYVTYMVNILISIKNRLPFPSHFWSLAVEEHFYLIWPLLMSRLPRATLKRILIGIVAGALVFRCILLCLISPLAVYVLTPCRIDCIALGGIVALVAREENGLQRLHGVATKTFPVSLLGCMIIAFLFKGWRQYGFIPETLGYSLSAFFFASALVFTLTDARFITFFSNPILRFFGKYSYGIYVLHVFVFHYTPTLFSLGNYGRLSLVAYALPGIFERAPFIAASLDALGYVVITLSLTLGLAIISWFSIERPALSLKRYFAYETANILAGERSSPIKH